MVRIQPGRDGGIPDFANPPVEIPQNVVSAIDAEQLVGGFEILDIKEHQGVVRLFFRVIQDVLRHADKTGAVVAAGQVILVVVFVKREDIVDPVENNLRAEGLGEEVHSPQLVGVENGRVGGIAGNHNHREIAQQILLFHIIQEAEAIQHGHLNIQQHQPVNPFPGLNHFNSLFSVFRLKNLVTVLQNVGKQLPIDGRVVYN